MRPGNHRVFEIGRLQIDLKVGVTLEILMWRRFRHNRAIRAFCTTHYTILPSTTTYAPALRLGLLSTWRVPIYLLSDYPNAQMVPPRSLSAVHPRNLASTLKACQMEIQRDGAKFDFSLFFLRPSRDLPPALSKKATQNELLSQQHTEQRAAPGNRTPSSATPRAASDIRQGKVGRLNARQSALFPNLPHFPGRAGAQDFRHLLGLMEDPGWRFWRAPDGKYSRLAGYKRRSSFLSYSSLPITSFSLIASITRSRRLWLVLDTRYSSGIVADYIAFAASSPLSVSSTPNFGAAVIDPNRDLGAVFRSQRPSSSSRRVHRPLIPATLIPASVCGAAENDTVDVNDTLGGQIPSARRASWAANSCAFSPICAAFPKLTHTYRRHWAGPRRLPSSLRGHDRASTYTLHATLMPGRPGEYAWHDDRGDEKTCQIPRRNATIELDGKHDDRNVDRHGAAWSLASSWASTWRPCYVRRVREHLSHGYDLPGACRGYLRWGLAEGNRISLRGGMTARGISLGGGCARRIRKQSPNTHEFSVASSRRRLARAPQDEPCEFIATFPGPPNRRRPARTPRIKKAIPKSTCHLPAAGRRIYGDGEGEVLVVDLEVTFFIDPRTAGGLRGPPSDEGSDLNSFLREGEPLRNRYPVAIPPFGRGAEMERGEGMLAGLADSFDLE
ncbi:hypothetical protein EV714DRAFT_240451, partial [Schizophyllum commune]